MRAERQLAEYELQNKYEHKTKDDITVQTTTKQTSKQTKLLDCKGYVTA